MVAPTALRVLVPVVEGHGEVEAVPELVRRWMLEAGRSPIAVRRPIRASGREALIRPNGIERYVAVAARHPGCVAIIVILDAHEACPKEEAPTLLARARESAGPIPVAVVEAKCEYEAWLLASAEALRGSRELPDDLDCPADPETIADAKGWLSRRMQGERSYLPTLDQVALTAKVDFGLARQRSPSFDKLIRSLETLLPAAA
jgi:hypothetical protein